MPLGIQRYTEKSIVVRGTVEETKSVIPVLKSIAGAKFGYYGGTPGWMYPLTFESQVRNALDIRGPYVDGPSPNPRQTRGDSPSTQAVPLLYSEAQQRSSRSPSEFPTFIHASQSPAVKLEPYSSRGRMRENVDDDSDTFSPSPPGSSMPPVPSVNYASEIDSLKSTISEMKQSFDEMRKANDEMKQTIDTLELSFNDRIMAELVKRLAVMDVTTPATS